MGQPIHPTWNLLPAENLCHGSGEVITIVVHQMVPITSELIAQLFHNPTHFLFGEVCTTDLNALPESKLFAKLVMVSWGYFEHTGEWERMASVCELGSEDFHARVEHTQPDRGRILVNPVHVVHVEYDRLATSHRCWQQFVATTILWHPETAGKGQIAGKPVREHHNIQRQRETKQRQRFVLCDLAAVGTVG